MKAIQNMVFRVKKKRTAGVQVTTRLDLLQYCRQYSLPSQDVCRLLLTDPAAEGARALMRQEYIYIPQSAASFAVEGACFTGPQQIEWARQLLQHDKQFVLHMDGKYKLHHGVWVLITLGTHCLRAVGETKVNQLTTTFVPLVYLFCKNHESTGACAMLSQALNILTNRCFNRKLEPGALMSDHSDGVRAGMLTEWDAPHGQCWPHIIRKLREGEHLHTASAY